MKKKYSTLRLILWDQLSLDISSLSDADPKEDQILFLETVHETSYVNHHIKKLAFLLSAMRHFAQELKQKQFHVEYVEISQEETSLTSGVKRSLKNGNYQKIVVTEPGEYRILEEIKTWEKKFKIPVEIYPDTRFYASRADFTNWAEGRKKILMESFYQRMRKKSGLLMDKKGEPMGGRWNFDQENRNPLKKSIDFPPPFQVKSDAITQKVLEEVKSRFSKHFGDLRPFWFAVSSKEAQKAFAHFVRYSLPYFGTYQDAMQNDESYLYHSVISHYLNAGLLNPRDICETVQEAYLKKTVPIESAEGYIRQILGWREYVRGVYWLEMPSFKKMNFLNAKRRLPWFYWSGDTKMNCLKQVITQTKKNGYSHHIQRLMVTGNFALLIGTLPEEICNWYLSVYADAHEWVELPNTLAMSQFADGGILATKPYASSGSYINRMSNFCKTCAFDVKKKEGEKACPFNYLYWNFLMRNEKKLKGNVRLAMPYKTLEKFSASRKRKIKADAKHFLDHLEETE